MKTSAATSLASLLLLSASLLPGQPAEKPEQAAPERARANFARPIVLSADDVRTIPDVPEGFVAARPDAPHGRLETLEYESAVTGTRRKANVYLPPGYKADAKYPVLYLLHGIGGNQYEWTGYVHADLVLDNLIASGEAVPMIVVFPNGRALADDSPPANPFTPENSAGFAKFERDLLDHLIPAVEKKYPVLADRKHRALGGLSMGGGQSLNFGLAHLDTFAWLAGFSSAPNTRKPEELLPHPENATKSLRLLYLSCGNKDGLINVSQAVHVYLKSHDVPHIWNVDDFAHEGNSWANNLHHFAQRLFRP